MSCDHHTSAREPSLAAVTNISRSDANSGPVIDLPKGEREGMKMVPNPYHSLLLALILTLST